MRCFVLAAVLALCATESTAAVGAQKSIAASAAWVKLPAEDSTAAFVTIENPTMYDVYLVSASSEIAGAIAFRRGAGPAAKEVKDLVVPAYGSLEMTVEAGYLWLSKLKKPLSENDSIDLQITTDGSLTLSVTAVARK